MTSQTLAIMMQASTREQRARVGTDGLLITPNLEDVGVIDFAAVDQTVQRGVAAAEAVRDRLGRFSVSEEEFRTFLAKQRRVRDELPRVSAIRASTDSDLSPGLLLSRLHAELEAPLDLDVLESDLADIYGINTFESVRYSLLGDESRPDHATLDVQADRKSWGPNYVRLGLEIRDDFDGRSAYNFAGEYTATEMNQLGGEWRTRVQIGDESRISTEWYQLLDEGGRFFFLPRLAYGQRRSIRFSTAFRSRGFSTAGWRRR